MKYMYFTLSMCLMYATTVICTPVKELINLHNNNDVITSYRNSNALSCSTVKIWNYTTGKTQKIHAHPTWNTSLIRKTSQHIITVLDGNVIKIFDIRTEKHLRTLIGPKGIFSALEATNNHIITRSLNAPFTNYDTVKIWDIATGACLHTFQELTSSIAINSTQAIIGCEYGGYIKIYNLETGICQFCLEGPIDMIAANDNYAITGNRFYRAKIWDLKTGKCLYTLAPNPDNCLLSVAINNSFAITAFSDSIKIWDLSTGKCLHTLTDPANKSDQPIFDFLAIDDNDYLMTGSTIGTIKRWNLKEGTCVETFPLF